MVDFVRKRLQVFVSSTFEDLRDERQAAVEAILSAGHIPAGMELFAAGDESQMEVIKQWIDDSDAYLIILGGRYGSIEPKSGKSYTQLEYEYALETKKALFACVVTEAAQEERIKRHGSSVIEKNEPKKLGEFRELVLSKMSKLWNDHKDIKLAIHETLNGFSRRDDLVGWVRADQSVNVPALADEVARLSKENAELRIQLDSRSEVTINGLKYSELKDVLKKKGVWDFLVAKRGMLGMGILRTAEVEQLVSLGLMKRRQENYDIFILTEPGMLLLNKLEHEVLGQPESSSGPA